MYTYMFIIYLYIHNIYLLSKTSKPKTKRNGKNNENQVMAGS